MISSTSFLLSAHNITSFTSALTAARSFSLIPPTGKTFPRSVISPVIAMCGLTFLLVKLETIDVNIAIPALGPSFGVAPSGT